MTFAVKLIKVPELKDMSGEEVFDLMINCRWIIDRYWMFEGDEEALLTYGRLEVLEHGCTEGHGDMSDEQFRSHCEEVFCFDFGEKGLRESWDMIPRRC